MHRRTLFALIFVFALSPAHLLARVDDALADRIGDLAGALADGNASAFIHLFDRDMPGREALEREVTGLLTAAECTSSIAPWDDVVEGGRHRVEVDWAMQVRFRGDQGQLLQRRQRIFVTLEKRGRKWLFVDVQPREFFSIQGR